MRPNTRTSELVTLPGGLAAHLVAKRLARRMALDPGTFGQAADPMWPNPAVDDYGEKVIAYLYDSFTVASNTAFPTQTPLFMTPIGVSNKTKAQTNMRAQGVLDSWDRFQVTAFGIWVSNNTVPNDLMSLFSNVSFTLNVRTKPYLEGPAQLFPAGVGGMLSAVAQTGTAPAGSATPFLTSNGLPTFASILRFPDAPINILAGENFRVDVTVETAWTTQNAGNPAGAGLTIMAILGGWRYRAVQ